MVSALERALRLRQQMGQAAQELRQTQHGRRLPFVKAWHESRRAVPLKAIPPASQSNTEPSKLLSAWIQWVGTGSLRTDVVTSHFHQHIDVVPNEVLLLPLETAAYLKAHDSHWQQMTVFPAGLVFGHDNASGLDTLSVGGVPVWGVHADSGFPYMDPDIGPQPNEGWRLLVVAGIPYLSNDR